MNTLTKMALGLIGRLKPARSQGYAVSTLPLAPARSGMAWPLMRAWIDRRALAQAMGLSNDEQVLLSQTVGWPAKAATV